MRSVLCIFVHTFYSISAITTPISSTKDLRGVPQSAERLHWRDCDANVPIFRHVCIIFFDKLLLHLEKKCASFLFTVAKINIGPLRIFMRKKELMYLYVSTFILCRALFYHCKVLFRHDSPSWSKLRLRSRNWISSPNWWQRVELRDIVEHWYRSGLMDCCGPNCWFYI